MHKSNRRREVKSLKQHKKGTATRTDHVSKWKLNTKVKS